MPGVDPNLRGAIRAKIAADYGEHTMLAGNKMPRPRRLPIDDLALEYVTGGGIPFFHMTRLWGAYSSGKSTALFKMFYAAQNFGKIRYRQLMALSDLSMRAGEFKQSKQLADLAKREREMGSLSCLYVCAEKTFDPMLPLMLGVDLSKDKLEIVPNTRIEVIGDVVQEALKGYHVIGVDSTSATISVDELGHKDGIFGDLPMLRAKRWGYNMDWWRDRMTAENCIIFTSHSREKRTGNNTFSAQATEKPPGGFSLNHEPGIILHFMKGSGLKRMPNGALKEIDSDTAKGSAAASTFGKFEPAGGIVLVRCEKNKTGVGGRTVLLHHDKRTADFDMAHEYEKFAKYFRAVQINDTWWNLPAGITTADGKTKTQQPRAVIQSNSDLRAHIEAVVLRCAEDPEFEASVLAGKSPELVALPAVAS